MHKDSQTLKAYQDARKYLSIIVFAGFVAVVLVGILTQNPGVWDWAMPFLLVLAIMFVMTIVLTVYIESIKASLEAVEEMQQKAVPAHPPR